MKSTKHLIFFLSISWLPLFFCAQGVQQFASLENFKLENGVTIRNCKIGFRTYGQLNKSRSNAVLVCGWFTGQSEGVSSTFINGGLLVSTW